MTVENSSVSTVSVGETEGLQAALEQQGDDNASVTETGNESTNDTVDGGNETGNESDIAILG